MTPHAYVPPPDGPSRGNTGCVTCGEVAIAHVTPGAELYRPHRICVSDYVVIDHPATAADLLDRAASIFNQLALAGAPVGTEAVLEIVGWLGSYDDLARS